MLLRGTFGSRYLQILVTADMAFSVALIDGMSSLASSSCIAAVNRAMESVCVCVRVCVFVVCCLVTQISRTHIS